MPDDLTTLGSRLRAARIARKAQQKDIAQQAGLPDSRTLWRYEADRKQPPLELLKTLADLLQVDITWLITGTGVAPEVAAERLAS